MGDKYNIAKTLQKLQLYVEIAFLYCYNNPRY